MRITVKKENDSSIGSWAILILFITFLVLKLTHVIDWSWWWITAPLWIPASVTIIMLIVLFIINYVNRKKVKS